MNHQPVQREFTLDHALVLINASSHQLNTNFSLKTVDKAGELSTYLCLMNNPKMQLTFRGAGSGLAQEAKVKAIYEAMEDNLLYQTLSQSDNPTIEMFSTLSSPSSTFLEQNELLPKVLKQEIFLKNSYPWLKLKKMTALDDSIYYPLGLLFPHTDHFEDYNKYVNQSSITQIANSTGIAMGASENEALIHGINDWIERDAYGLFLLNTIIKKAKPARVLIKQTLPNNIRNHIELIENTYNDELMLIDITSNINIPSIFVSFTKQGVPVQPSGLGASLCKDDALQQALFEALQARDRYNDNTVLARNKTIQHYQKHPLLLKAFKVDLMELRNAGHTIDINWDEVITHQVDPDLTNQLHVMMEMIRIKKIDAFYNVLFKDVNGLTLIYMLLVGVETFGMIREGLFIPIKKRGLGMI